MSIASILLNRSRRYWLIGKARAQLYLKLTRPKMTELYFAYGGNMEPGRFSRLGFSVTKIGPGILQNHKIEFSMPCEYKGIGFATVMVSPGSSVYGVLLNCDQSLLEYLDCTEWRSWGYYDRVKMRILSNDQFLDAWVYIACNKVEGLAPMPGYLNMILQAGSTNGFPEQYLNQVKATPSRKPIEIDINFNLSDPAKPRRKWPLGSILLPFHDALRDWLCKKI